MPQGTSEGRSLASASPGHRLGGRGITWVLGQGWTGGSYSHRYTEHLVDRCWCTTSFYWICSNIKLYDIQWIQYSFSCLILSFQISIILHLMAVLCVASMMFPCILWHNINMRRNDEICAPLHAMSCSIMHDDCLPFPLIFVWSRSIHFSLPHYKIFVQSYARIYDIYI